MNNPLITEADKIALLRDATIALSVSQAQLINDQLNSDMSRFKLNLLVMKINRGFEALGYKDFKSYVLAELTLSYDAVIKQMIAANTAIKLFGPEKVGVYSDTSMITLGSCHFEIQVKVIIDLKAKFKKQIDEDLTPQELTKKNVDLALNEISPQIFKSVTSALPSEFAKEGYSQMSFNLSNEIFQIADEEEFKAKHGFSRWDTRSLTLVKADQLASMTEEELYNELTSRWSLVDMLNHIKTYHSDSLDSALENATRHSHSGLVSFCMDLYFPQVEDETSEEVSVLESEFFADAEDASTKSQFKKLRQKMRRSFFRKVDSNYKAKNPKAAILLVIADELDPKELRLAESFFAERYSEVEEEEDFEESDDSEDYEEDDDDFDDEDDDNDEDGDVSDDEDDDNDEDGDVSDDEEHDEVGTNDSDFGDNELNGEVVDVIDGAEDSDD